MLKRLTILFILSLFLATPVFANLGEKNSSQDSPGENSGGLIDQLNANIRKQDELRKKIADAQAQEKTLAAEITNLDAQIDLTKLKMEETETRLTQLVGDIGSVSEKIAQTKEELEYTNQVASLRLRAIYKQSFAGGVGSFVGATNFNDFVTKQKYAEAIRSQDLALLKNLDDLKADFHSQKNTLEDKKQKEEQLKGDLEKQRADLNTQQNSKNYILGVTKNNEKEYQKLLSQVQSELASIARALGGGGIKIGPVRRGDVVAFQGNTGCSTGTHVHFGLYIGGGAVNPQPYLNSGALGWPETNPRVTQGYGANYDWYMRNFGMPGHNGIDMTVSFGYPIRAAADGVAYLSSDASPCWLTGTVGKGIVINHYNGWKTIYWHIR